MNRDDEYRFKIDAYSPETIPMARLAEYLGELAKLMGNQERVHFQKLAPGSTVVHARVEREAAPKVARRVEEIQRGEAPDDARAVFNRLNDMLREDNAIGELEPVVVDKDKIKVLRFPGRELPRPEKIGPFTQTTIVDGELVRIGGRDDTAHAQIVDLENKVWPGIVTRDIARQLAPYLYEGPILRVEGVARWERTAAGLWELKNFRIRTFKVLSDEALVKTVQRLREVKGSDWKSMDDPIGFIRGMRSDDDEIH